MIPQTTHILVVDDDPKVRQLLRRCFEPEGYRVSEAKSQAEVMKALQHGDVDLVTLDLHLGGEDGLTIAREIRNTADIAIVMITGKDDVIDRVVGLELGADDYITKPFHIRELLARIRTVLRRSAGNQRQAATSESPEKKLYRFGDWTADFESLQVRFGDEKPADLTSADIRLLEVFAKRPNRVLSRDQLMDLVKGTDWNPNDRTIDNQIARLRKKIEDNPKEPQFLKTVRGEGYVFIPDGGSG